MKFVYEYRSSDNVRHEGEIDAPSRDAAFQALKARGIRPSRLQDKPGVLNWLFGKGKRWLAIVLLAVIATVAVFMWVRLSEQAADALLYEDRAQIYGDPFVIGEAMRMGWFNEFKDMGDRYLARHAIPAAECNCAEFAAMQGAIVKALTLGVDKLVKIAPDDLAEIAKIKRMVNGMKRELGEYIADGGSVAGYMKRLEIRQKAERGIFERVSRELSRTADDATWRKRNAELRAMGLPMVSPPEN